MPTHPSLPLEGIRVLDLTRALAGPFCTTLLADLGADVVKVESLNGDMIRHWGPYAGETSLYHLAVNRNKRSVALDLRSADGARVLRKLADESDVIVENFRPGVLAKLGLDEKTLKDDLPHVIVASVTGFGATGPLQDDPSFDQIAQGMAGLMSLTGTPGASPMRVGLPIADLLSGMFSALGVAASLVGRLNHGRTASVETSLLESVLGVLTFQSQRYLTGGEVPAAAGNDHPVMSPYGVFATQDKPLNLAVATQAQWERLCTVLDAPEWRSDPLFRDGAKRHVNRDALRKSIEKRMRELPAREWLRLLRGAGIPVGPIHDMAGVFRDEQIDALQMVSEIEHPTLGRIRVLRGPLRLEGQPVPVTRPAPLLGEHTREVLAETGFDPAEAQRLIDDGAAATPEAKANADTFEAGDWQCTS